MGGDDGRGVHDRVTEVECLGLVLRRDPDCIHAIGRILGQLTVQHAISFSTADRHQALAIHVPHGQGDTGQLDAILIRLQLQVVSHPNLRQQEAILLGEGLADTPHPGQQFSPLFHFGQRYQPITQFYGHRVHRRQILPIQSLRFGLCHLPGQGLSGVKIRIIDPALADAPACPCQHGGEAEEGQHGHTGHQAQDQHDGRGRVDDPG